MENERSDSAGHIFLRTFLLVLIFVAVVVCLLIIGWRRNPDRSVLGGVPFFASKADGSDTVLPAAGQGQTLPVQSAGAPEDVQTPGSFDAVAYLTESADGETAPDPASGAVSDALDSVPARLPDIDPESWELILANPTHSIADYHPKTAVFEDVELDERIIPDMEAFVEDARSQGLEVVMNSGYRSYEEQQWLFDKKVQQYDGDEETAATIVARPGTSEHQTGLAADITDGWYEFKNESLEDTELYQWMSTHCQDYGFIVRFPKGKEEITGIIYEPWHFRYVGKEAAAYIMEHQLTLEEFLASYGIN